uniref:Tyrosine--tRNA ligase n=1 Tax=uncultured myxobacterium HF0200_01L06 TaxID=723556 RepID=E7C3J5_9BACT|nr:tyrosyl-tRNA synthetase [uncultured myxobacterium HF0200_01L06]
MSAERREVERQLERMREGAVDFIGEEELAGRLERALGEGRPLRVKLGMDPSSPDLHLGHAVVLEKLRIFQELGHTPIFLIGDFTARIGDPSGKKKTRPPLGDKEVTANAATYVSQVAKMLDADAAEIRFNSEWMDAMTPQDFVRLCSHTTVSRLLERDDFSKRYAAQTPIAVHEFLYPFVQAYDSVALEADVELGGTDQTFNLLMGREIQRAYGKAPQAVITHPLLVGTDGHEKMSKSLGNSIALLDPPEEIYGKIMSISDALLPDYVAMLPIPRNEELLSASKAVVSGAGDPLALKHELARRVVERFYDAGSSEGAADHFRRVVQERGKPTEVAQYEYSLAGAETVSLLDLVDHLGLAGSRGELRRLVSQGAVSVDDERVSDPLLALGAGSYLLKLGRRRFAQVQIG